MATTGTTRQSGAGQGGRPGRGSPPSGAGARRPSVRSLALVSAVAASVVVLTPAQAAGAATGHPAGTVHLVGRRAPALASAALRPATRRSSAGVTATSYSYNWSGLGKERPGIKGARGQWTVPAVRASGPARYSSSWVGVDGMTNDHLIQTGTEQDTSDGYFAWYEILPSPAIVIRSANGNRVPVRPGDKISAFVVRASVSVWTISIQDSTGHWAFARSFNYTGPGTSAEWIEEAPTVDNHQSSPAAFGTVAFTGTATYRNDGSGLRWYPTAMNASNEITMLDPTRTKILAMPSAPSAVAGGQRFTDTYYADRPAP